MLYDAELLFQILRCQDLEVCVRFLVPHGLQLPEYVCLTDDCCPVSRRRWLVVAPVVSNPQYRAQVERSLILDADRYGRSSDRREIMLVAWSVC
jgi:hypothetical protein